MTSSTFRQCFNISPYLSIDYINFPQSWYASTRYNINIYECFQYLSLNTPLTPLNPVASSGQQKWKSENLNISKYTKPKLFKLGLQQP